MACVIKCLEKYPRPPEALSTAQTTLEIAVDAGTGRNRNRSFPSPAKKKNLKASNFLVGLHILQRTRSRALPLENPSGVILDKGQSHLRFQAEQKLTW